MISVCLFFALFRDIPVDSKYIAEPHMHSVPAVSLSRDGRWLACQSLDNQILVYDALHKMRLNKKKNFKGHMVKKTTVPSN